LAGFVIFTMASVACGLSTSLGMLIFFRAVQAAGAAMSFSISTAIIFQIFHHGEQGRAMGYIGTTVSLASIAGPILGGYLVDYMGWKYIFLINLPIGIVLLALASKYMKIEETISKKLDLDWRGATVLIIFIVSLMLFLPSKKVRPAHNRHNVIHHFQLLSFHPGSLLFPGRHGLLALPSGQRISHCAGHNGLWLTTGRLDI
jgi:MFS family permease